MNDDASEILRKLPISKATRKRNPKLFAVGGVESTKRKRDERSESEDPGMVAVPKGVAFRISLTVVRRRKMDEHDNLRSGLKPLADAITESLGFKSDDDPRLTWEYPAMIISPGSEGVMVKIDRYETLTEAD